MIFDKTPERADSNHLATKTDHLSFCHWQTNDRNYPKKTLLHPQLIGPERSIHRKLDLDYTLHVVSNCTHCEKLQTVGDVILTKT